MINKSGNILIVVIICILWISLPNANAQNNKQEQINVHLSSNVMISGAFIEYKVYLCPKVQNKQSGIVYFEISNHQNNIVQTWKSRISNGSLWGKMKIDESLDNGYYIFKAYTLKTITQSSKQAFVQPLFIHKIHEQPVDTATFYAPILPNEQLTYKTPDHLFAINFDQSEKINLAFKPEKDNAWADFSASLTELNPFFDSTATSTVFKRQNINIQNSSSLIEKEYFQLMGQVIFKNDSTPVKNSLVYLAYPDSTIHFEYTFTDDQGAFCFKLDESFDNKTLYLQVANNTANKEIAWNIAHKTIDVSRDIAWQKTPLSPQQLNYIENLQKRELVYRVYKNTPQPKETQAGTFKPNLFFDPVYVTHPSNYLELNNFKEISENIIPSVRYRKQNEKVQLGVVLKEFSLVYDDVLVCVDGIPCLDLNWLDTLSSPDIKKIEIYNSVLLYGDLTFNGVIGIYTNNTTFDHTLLTEHHYSFNNQFHSNTPAKCQQQKPVVLPTVYWCPQVSNNNSISQEIIGPEIGKHYQLIIKGASENAPFYKLTKKITLQE